MVATLTTNLLNPATQNRVADLLGEGVTLAAIATWADEIRSIRPNTGPWHTVNIPREVAGYDPLRDCKDGCVASAIDQALRLLQDESKGRAVRAEALRWVVHLVADLHQPLHAIADRRGHTYMSVRFFGRQTNLHRLWDEDLIDYVYLDPTVLQQQVQAVLQTGTWQARAGGGPQAWAEETHRTARDAGFVFPANPEIDARYVEKALPVIHEQLAKAAVRLAWALNQAFANSF